MSSNIVNQQPYLRTSRSFPNEIEDLQEELYKAYIDTALYVNARIIGVFPTNKPSVTGESWNIFQNKKQQTLRQVFTFITTASIDHGIILTRNDGFTRMWGTYTDGTNWYGIIAGTSVAIAGQISFYITPTQIVFMTGAGAPALTSGRIVLEWLSDRTQSTNI